MGIFIDAFWDKLKSIERQKKTEKKEKSRRKSYRKTWIRQHVVVLVVVVLIGVGGGDFDCARSKSENTNNLFEGRKKNGENFEENIVIKVVLSTAKK